MLMEDPLYFSLFSVTHILLQLRMPILNVAKRSNNEDKQTP